MPVAAAASRPTRISPPARPKNEPMTSITPTTARTTAGYVEPATGAPATSTMPTMPTASAASAMVNQNSLGPRLRGLRGAGVTYLVACGGAGGCSVRLLVRGRVRRLVGRVGRGGLGSTRPARTPARRGSSPSAGPGVTAFGPAPGGAADGAVACSRAVWFSLRLDMTSHTTSATRISGPGTQNQSHCPTRRQTPRMPARMSATLRLRSSRPSGWRCSPSSGRSSQPAAYITRPAPPNSVSTTNATRTTSGSMSRWRAMPPATPPILRSTVIRRSRLRSRTWSAVTRGPVPIGAGRSVGHGEPGAGASGPLVGPAGGGVLVMSPTLRPGGAPHHRGRP